MPIYNSGLLLYGKWVHPVAKLLHVIVRKLTLKPADLLVVVESQPIYHKNNVVVKFGSFLPNIGGEHFKKSLRFHHLVFKGIHVSLIMQLPKNTYHTSSYLENWLGLVGQPNIYIYIIGKLEDRGLLETNTQSALPRVFETSPLRLAMRLADLMMDFSTKTHDGSMERVHLCFLKPIIWPIWLKCMANVGKYFHMVVFLWKM